MDRIVGQFSYELVNDCLNNLKERMISRTRAVALIKESKGRFFTVTFTKNNGEVRTLNCNFKKGNITPLGYITVYSPNDGSYKNINPKTIQQLSINGVEYDVK